jgi:hypothetical protein
MEVVEYVRAGVQLIHDELTEARDAESFPDMHDDSQQDGGDNPRLN